MQVNFKITVETVDKNSNWKIEKFRYLTKCVNLPT